MSLSKFLFIKKNISASHSGLYEISNSFHQASTRTKKTPSCCGRNELKGAFLAPETDMMQFLLFHQILIEKFTYF